MPQLGQAMLKLPVLPMDFHHYDYEIISNTRKACS